jgi:hypothetical protein
VDREIFALFMEQRTRKTKVIVDTAAERFRRGDVDGALIVAWPNGVQHRWAEDWPLDWPAEMGPFSLVPWRSGKTTRDELRELLAFEGFAVFATNSEAVIRADLCYEFIQHFLKRRRLIVVADECFVGDTQILTSKGPCSISRIRVGDFVLNPSGPSRIVGVKKRFTEALIRVNLIKALPLICTPNHPLMTTEGWVCAGNLIAGDVVLDNNYCMRILRENRGKIWQTESPHTEILRQILLSEMAYASTGDFSQSARSRSSATAWSFFERSQTEHASLEQRFSVAGRSEREATKDRCGTKSKRDLQIDPGWEWETSSFTSEDDVRNIRLAVDNGTRHSIAAEAAQLSNFLQNRFGSCRESLGDRIRWQQSSIVKSQSTRCEEGSEITGIRVESVENIQLSSPEVVYDLHVEGDHRYYANGILVHNSSYMKTPGSAITKRMLAIGRHPHAILRRILDGTPSSEGSLDLWAPCAFLDWRLLGHKSFATFRNRYAVMTKGYAAGGREFQTQAVDAEGRKLYQNLSELREKLKSFSYRVLYSDVAQSPEPEYRSCFFELAPKQRRVYDKLDNEFEIELAGGSMPVALQITRLIRLQMISRNYYPPVTVGAFCPACAGEGCERCDGMGMIIDTTRLERIAAVNPALEALIEDAATYAGHPIVIWSRFVQDCEDVAEALRGLGRRVARYDGTVSARDRAAAYDGFRAGAFDTIVATTSSGITRGHDLSKSGNEWTRAAYYYSNSYVRRDRDQSRFRTEALDRPFPVEIIDLIGVDTRDAPIIASLRAKLDISNEILGDRPRNGV